MLHTAEHEAEHTCLDFSDGGRRGGNPWSGGGGGFGVSHSIILTSESHLQEVISTLKLPRRSDNMAKM